MQQTVYECYMLTKNEAVKQCLFIVAIKIIDFICIIYIM